MPGEVVDERQPLARDEDSVGPPSIAVNDDPVYDIGALRFREGDDRIALFKRRGNVFEVQIVPQADTDAIGTEAADKTVLLKPHLTIGAALFEKPPQGRAVMEGVEDHGSGDETTGVRFDLAVSLYV